MQCEEQRQNVRLSTGQGLLALSCLTQCISLMSQIEIGEGLVCLGLHYRSDGSSYCTSKVQYRVTYLWILLILHPVDNFYIVLIQATGMGGAPDESVFGSLLSKSWPNSCWTRRMAEGFAGCPPALPGGGQLWSSILQLMSFVQEDRIFV